MTEKKPITRRSALKAGGTLAVLGLGTGTAAANSAGPQTVESADSITQQKASSQTASRSGFYSGTVDRIVDGEHVVILLESGGRTVDQIVTDRDRLPNASEGDSAFVWLRGGNPVAIRTW